MKIVLAVDGSKHARWATEWVARMTFATSPRVTALHVVDLASLRAPFVVQPMGVIEPLIQAEARKLESQAKRVVADTKTLLSSLGVKGRVIIEKGPVAPTILKHVAGRRSLVVIGSRGLDALDRFMLGSVSTKVTLHAPCSVLVVKQPPRLVRQVLLATDGSKASELALQFLLREVRLPDAKRDIDVTVMQVMPSFANLEIKEAWRALVHQYAEKLAKAGYRVKELSRPGNPAEEIIRAAQRNKTDLIVAGAKGLGAMGRFFLGSVSTKLVEHSACSVLVVR